ncbi:phage baseplate protein [Pseudomonas aeruginosa]
MVMLINRHVGTVRLDAVISENHVSTLKTTANPVESGAQVIDHAVLEPKTITITGTLVDHAPPGEPLPSLLAAGARRAPDFLDQVAPAGAPGSLTEQARRYAARQLQSWLAPTGRRAAEELAAWLPSLAPPSIGDLSLGSQRVQQIHSSLLDLQKSGEPLDIQTGFHLYRNMLLTSISAEQVVDGALKLTIAARELHLVEIRTMRVPSAGRSGSGRAARQAAPRQARGATRPEPADKSLLKSIAGLFK